MQTKLLIMVNGKKIVYIAHPIGGDVENNLADLRRIIREINLTKKDVVPNVPYYCDCASGTDDIPSERKRGMDNNEIIILSGIYDELWLTGSRISLGMMEEVRIFKLLGKDIIDYTGDKSPF